MRRLPDGANVTNTLAYDLDYDDHTAGNGSDSATWTFTNIPAGSYQVFAHWVQFVNRATNAPYTIYDGSTPQGTVQVNQQLAPVGDLSEGVTWQSLGTFNNSTGTLTVRLGDNANGYVIADAIRIVRGGVTSTAPEIDVFTEGQSIATGEASPSFDAGTDFGGVPATSNSLTQTFTITNSGNGALHLNGSPRVSITGADPQDFTILTQPAFTVAPGATTTFQVMFHPTATGLRTAEISIGNDDANESQYTFEVQGTGTDPGPTQLIVDDSDPGYQATNGAWTTNPNAIAVDGEYRSAPAGNGSAKSTWSFNNLVPGNYTVYATWIPFGNLRDELRRSRSPTARFRKPPCRRTSNNRLPA